MKSIKRITKPTLADLLLLFRRSIVEKLRGDGMKQDLTFSQIEALNFIGVESMKTMKEIADYLKITPPSATTIVSEMEKKNLLKRYNTKRDRRLVYVKLTPEAKSLFSSINKHKEIILKKMTAKLSKNDRASLERIIRIIISK